MTGYDDDDDGDGATGYDDDDDGEGRRRQRRRWRRRDGQRSRQRDGRRHWLRRLPMAVATDESEVAGAKRDATIK